MTAESAADAGEIKVQRSREPESAAPDSPRVPAVTQAIEQVNQVIEELKRALDEMEEGLELAERQKLGDEREIESLQRALRRLHRPAPAGPPRQ